VNFKRLINPRFINPVEISCTCIKDDDSEMRIEFAVPDGDPPAKGQNKYYDYLIENFNLSDLKERYKNELAEHRRRQQERQDRGNAAKETERLKVLFDHKAQVFEMPFVKESAPELKSALRRASSLSMLNVLVVCAFQEYLSSKEMSYNEYLDYVDELVYGEK